MQFSPKLAGGETTKTSFFDNFAWIIPGIIISISFWQHYYNLDWLYLVLIFSISKLYFRDSELKFYLSILCTLILSWFPLLLGYIEDVRMRDQESIGYLLLLAFAWGFMICTSGIVGYFIGNQLPKFLNETHLKILILSATLVAVITTIIMPGVTAYEYYEGLRNRPADQYPQSAKFEKFTENLRQFNLEERLEDYSVETITSAGVIDGIYETSGGKIINEYGGTVEVSEVDEDLLHVTYSGIPTGDHCRVFVSRGRLLWVGKLVSIDTKPVPESVSSKEEVNFITSACDDKTFDTKKVTYSISLK